MLNDVKHELAAAVVRRIAGWEQHAAAVLLRDDQPRVSDLRRGKLDRVSIKRLLTFLTRLGEDVEIHVSKRAPTPRILRRGSVTVRDDANT